MKSLFMIKEGSSQSGLLHSVIVLLSWTGLAQLVSVVAMFVLPRLFLPEQFGVFSVFSSVVVMLGIVAAARYEFAIGLPREDAEGAALFTLCVGLASAAAAISLLIFLLLPGQNSLFDRFPELQPWWPWIAAGVASIGWYNAVSYLALRGGRFDAVGKSKVAIALATALGQVLAALFVSRSEGSLIIPFLLGQLFGVAIILVAVPRHSLWNPQLGVIASVARRYIRFPAFVATGSLLDGMSVMLPVAVIAAVLSPADAGIYALAERTLRMPVTLIGSSILQVLYKRFADLRDDRAACRRLLLVIWRNVALVAALPCAVLVLIGGPVFAVLFGETWQSSGVLAQTMAIGTFVLFVSYPTSNVLIVNERSRSYLLWQSTQMLLVALGLWFGLQYGDGSMQSAIKWLVACQILAYLVSMVLQWLTVAGVGNIADKEASA